MSKFQIGDRVGPAEELVGIRPAGKLPWFQAVCEEDGRGIIIDNNFHGCPRVKWDSPYASSFSNGTCTVSETNLRKIEVSSENKGDKKIESECACPSLFWFDHQDDCPYKGYRLASNI